jgi:probable rRNA maturation factor
VIVNIFDQQSALPLSHRLIKQAVKAVLTLEERVCDEVAIHFVDIPSISQLHQQYFHDPSPTDCISFPMDEGQDPSPYSVLGEVFICPEVAINYTKKRELDPYEETTLYLVHGLLHLMGYDDLEPEDRKVMKQAEKEHLRNLKKLHLLLSA